MHCYENNAGENHNMVSVLWRAQPPESIRFTHRNEKAVVPSANGDEAKDCERNSVSSHYLNSLNPSFWTLSCLSTISLCVDINKTEERASRGEAGDGLCVADLSDGKRPPQKEGCGEKGLGKMEGQSFCGTEARPIFGFCSPSTGEEMHEWGVLVSWSPGFLGPGQVIAAWLLTRQSLDQPLYCPPKTHSVQRVVQPPWGREWEKEKQGCQAPMFIKVYQLQGLT